MSLRRVVTWPIGLVRAGSTERDATTAGAGHDGHVDEGDDGMAGAIRARRVIAMVGSGARRVQPWLAGLFALGVLVQAFLAGAALPQLGGSGDFESHKSVGYTVMGILALALLIAGGIARSGPLVTWGSVAVFLLYIVQTLLPTFSGSMPALAALHPVNAVILFGLAAWMFVRGMRPASA
jgi:Family of unknown function (DUF6220)